MHSCLSAWIWADSGSWWGTGKPGVGLKAVRQDGVAEHQCPALGRPEPRSSPRLTAFPRSPGCWRRGLGSQSQRAHSVIAALGLQSVGLVVPERELGCSETRGIFLDQGLNPCPLYWRADSDPRDRGRPRAFTVFVGLSQRAVESIRLHPVWWGWARSLIIPLVSFFLSHISSQKIPVSSRFPKQKLYTYQPLKDHSSQKWEIEESQF